MAQKCLTKFSKSNPTTYRKGNITNFIEREGENIPSGQWKIWRKERSWWWWRGGGDDHAVCWGACSVAVTLWRTLHTSHVALMATCILDTSLYRGGWDEERFSQSRADRLIWRSLDLSVMLLLHLWFWVSSPIKKK